MDNPLMDVEGARERLEAWKTRTEQQAAQIRDAGLRLQALRVTASDDNRIIEATVDHSGNLVDVQANARVTRQPAEFTARAMLQAYQNAKRKLAEEAAEVVRETVGTGSSTGRAFLEGFRTGDGAGR
jgi:DNA-binding protein YbaB